MNRLTRSFCSVPLVAVRHNAQIRPALATFVHQLRMATSDNSNTTDSPSSSTAPRQRFDIKIENFDTTKRPSKAPTSSDSSATAAAGANGVESTSNTENLEQMVAVDKNANESGSDGGSERTGSPRGSLGGDSFGSNRYDPSSLFGFKRSTIRMAVLGAACAVGAALFFTLRTEPISQTTNRRNMHFFAKLNADPSVEVTYSGLMYRVLHDPKQTKVGQQEGEETETDILTGGETRLSASPDLDNHVVKIHYQGKMLDGQVFDTSFQSEPVTFAAKTLIKGLHQGIAKMTRGCVYEFFIPPHLAYGERGSKFIPAHEPLVFTVQLIDFWKDQEAHERSERKMLAL